jgi:hypothetical protein
VQRVSPVESNKKKCRACSLRNERKRGEEIKLRGNNLYLFYRRQSEGMMKRKYRDDRHDGQGPGT